MAWFKTASLSVAANSKKATGHGTRWADNKQGIGLSRCCCCTAQALYEIASEVRDTELLLVFGPPNAVKEASYAIVTYHGGSYVDFGRELAVVKMLPVWRTLRDGAGIYRRPMTDAME